MLRLGIDIDGTVTAAETFVPYLNKSFGLNITLEDIKQYDLTTILNINQEEFWKWMDHHEPTIYQQAPTAPYAKQVLNEWNDTHQLIYITARRKHLEELTYKWFHENKVSYHHIDLVGTHDKLSAAKNHEIDIFFEDKHDNAVMLAEELCIPVLLFDAPYNRDPIPNNVIRISNWLEAKTWVNHFWNQDKQSNKMILP
ncbi:hypothetical protein [Bacillus sp. FJAT-47783]|uniref:hypothetical protein n=1 Tax=Bacillus sp. FJAT-47783 TaxID=2922712 RepID=UPI001FAC2762|nr:hypothetical protein [Bacillus sp. FJAT-47783]